MTVTFASGSDMMCVVLETTDDNIYEFDETLSLQLDTTDPLVMLAPSQANVTITDDDQGNNII